MLLFWQTDTDDIFKTQLFFCPFSLFRPRIQRIRFAKEAHEFLCKMGRKKEGEREREREKERMCVLNGDN